MPSIHHLDHISSKESLDGNTWRVAGERNRELIIAQCTDTYTERYRNIFYYKGDLKMVGKYPESIRRFEG